MNDCTNNFSNLSTGYRNLLRSAADVGLFYAIANLELSKIFGVALYFKYDSRLINQLRADGLFMLRYSMTIGQWEVVT